MYESIFEQDLITAIQNMQHNPSKENKNIIIELFKDEFDDNKATIYEMFSNNKLTLAQQEILFDSIEVKQKCNLYNTISIKAREKYNTYLQSSEVTDTNPKAFSKFMTDLRGQAVADALTIEQGLLDEGLCTRDWDIEQLKEIYQFKVNGDLKVNAGTPHEFNPFNQYEYNVSIVKKGENKGKVNVNKVALEGHHMQNVNDFAVFAGDGKNIQFLTKDEHLAAHAKDFHNKTIAFFDGEKYIGVKYEAPHIEANNYVEGKFVTNGSIYEFDAVNNTFKEVPGVSVESGKTLPLQYKSQTFPSVDKAKEIFGEDVFEKWKPVDQFNARIGITEYKKLGIDIDASHVQNNSGMAEYLRSVGDDASQLAKTTVYLNEDGVIDEVLVKLDDSADNIKIVSSQLDDTANRYAVTAVDYKRMNAISDDFAQRYKGIDYDNLTKIDRLKLKKADAIFAEKSVCVSLNDLSDSVKKDAVEKMLQVADNPELANKAIFYFDESGKVMDFNLSGEIVKNRDSKFAAKFADLRYAPSDYEIMYKYHGFGVTTLTDLQKHKLRAGVGMYGNMGIPDIKELLGTSKLTDEETGKMLSKHFIEIADDPVQFDTVKFHYDDEGKLLKIETSKHPFTGTSAFSLSVKEAKMLPTDDAMCKMFKNFDSLDSASKFSLKYADVKFSDDVMKQIYSNFDEMTPQMKLVAKQAQMGMGGNEDELFKAFDIAKKLNLDISDVENNLKFKSLSKMSLEYSDFSDLSDAAKKTAQYNDWLCNTNNIKNITTVDELTKHGSKLSKIGKVGLKTAGLVTVGGIVSVVGVKGAFTTAHAYSEMVNQYKETGSADPNTVSKFTSSAFNTVSFAIGFIPGGVGDYVGLVLDIGAMILEVGTGTINAHINQLDRLWNEATGEGEGVLSEYHEYLNAVFELEKHADEMTDDEKNSLKELKLQLLDFDGNGDVDYFEGIMGQVMVKSIVNGNLDAELAQKYIDELCSSEVAKELIRGYFSRYFGELFDNASEAQPPRDPLAIDIKGDGIKLTKLEDGVNFDLDNNGFNEKTAWIGNEDGFLVLDRNNNGIVDNGSELFGDQVLNPDDLDGRMFKNGFEALAYYDNDKDGKKDGEINSDDIIFSNLKVWIDKNQNGKTDEGELKSLDDLGIISISLDYKTKDITDSDTGTKIAETAKVTIKKDNVIRTVDISEFWFPVNTTDTTQGTLATIGNVPDIASAIESDETGELLRLYNNFCSVQTVEDMRYYLKQILYFITNASDIEIDSRGGNIDARDLKVVESFIGREFIGVDGSIPNTNAANMLRTLYADIENYYFNTLVSSSLSNMLEGILAEETDSGIKYDISFLKMKVDAILSFGGDFDTVIYSIGSYLNAIDKSNGTTALFDEFKSYCSEKSIHYSKVLESPNTGSTFIGTDENDDFYGVYSNEFVFGGNGDDLLNGGAGHDIIYGGEGSDYINGGNDCDELYGENGDDILLAGNGNDILYGGADNDNLNGNTGNDVINGDAGNDTLVGGVGNDTYYFSTKHGKDTIYDTDGENKVIFSDNISLDNYDVSINLNQGFVLTNNENGDVIALPDFLTNPLSYEFISNTGDLQFPSGSKTQIITEGTEIDDYLKAVDDSFNILYGNEGDDTLEGGTGIDFIYGGLGDDIIDGKSGVNVIFGEDGNDKLYDGEDGSYLNGGDGEDELYGGNGNNVLIGGVGNDIIYDGNNVSYLLGENGDDFLYGGGGADILDGGVGNDYLQGDHGGDTYIFSRGYETDIINASSDLNTIVIQGYRVSSMINTRNANNDLIINFGSSDSIDCLIIDHFFDYNSNRDFKFVFDDGTVLEQYDITAKYAPIYGTEGDEWLSIQNSDNGIIYGNNGNDGVSGGSGNDELYGNSGNDTLYGNDGDDILDGGIGIDSLNGGNGTDTYIFAKGYGSDSVNEWSTDKSIIKFTDINSDEVTINDQWGNLIVTVNDTEDILTINSFKWGQAIYTFEFADGAIASINKDTFELEFSKLPDILEISEDEIAQSNAELLTELYTEDSVLAEPVFETNNIIISEIAESTIVAEETCEITDQTDIQVMVLTENMSAFADDSNVYDATNITDVTTDTITNQLFVNTTV